MNNIPQIDLLNLPYKHLLDSVAELLNCYGTAKERNVSVVDHQGNTIFTTTIDELYDKAIKQDVLKLFPEGYIQTTDRLEDGMISIDLSFTHVPKDVRNYNFRERLKYQLKKPTLPNKSVSDLKHPSL